MILQTGPILSPKELQRLKEHKYSCTSLSVLEPYLQPFWGWVLSLTPLWVAPNLITIVGLIINIATTLVLVYCCPTATERAPWWATGSAALGLFLYQTLDAIDGKQARRTGTAGPLGELFDHGCDSVSTMFVCLASSCSVRLGQNLPFMLFQHLIASSLFYCAHWQTYVSGTMQFGRLDVTESQYVVISIMLLSAVDDFCGLNIWNSQVPGAPFSMTAQGIYIFLGCTMALIHLASSLPACFTSNGGGKNGSTIADTSVLSPASPLLLVILPAVSIALMSQEHIYQAQPILYCVLFGFIACKITNRLIVAHMCKGEMTQCDASLLAPFLLVINQYFGCIVKERSLLLISLAWVTTDLVWYCTGVCREICKDFQIHTFSIAYKRKENLHEKSH